MPSDRDVIASRHEFAQAVLNIPEMEREGQDERFSVVQRFLEQIGELDRTFTRGVLDLATAEALSRYQRVHGLEVTGVFDAPTREFLTRPRCALPDPADPLAFKTICAWDKRILSYAFDTGTPDIPNNDERQAVRNAFATWQAQINLEFVEVQVTGNPDILIAWRPTMDPDLNMTGSTIAHADYPPGCSVVVTPGTLPLPLHFDDGENWSLTGAAGTFDVETVALHEIGHLIGLDHSTVGTVMFDTINGVARDLTRDDIDGATSLYGRRFAARPGATVTALLPFEGHVDLFATSSDGTVISTFFEAGSGWKPSFGIHPERKMQPGATVTALLPFEGHVDLFVTGTDGAVWSTFFEAAGGWRNWFLVP